MPLVARILAFLPLCLAAACAGPPPVKQGNPLLGPWQLVSAPGVGSRSFKKVTFAPDLILADGRQPIEVQAYQITPTKVHVLEWSGRVRSYRVIHGALICEEPPPELAYRNSPNFDDDRKRTEACYRPAPAGQQPPPRQNAPSG